MNVTDLIVRLVVLKDKYGDLPVLMEDAEFSNCYNKIGSADVVDHNKNPAIKPDYIFIGLELD